MQVLVTRPEPAAGATAGRLLALGHRVLVAPVMTIRRSEDPPPDGVFDALILTSANAVPALARLAVARSRPAFVVGRRTAERARAAGVGTVIWRENALALAGAIEAELPRGATLLHVAGRDRKAEPAATLAAAGFVIAVWETYAANALDRLPPEIDAALEAGGLDAVLHLSRRTSAILCALIREAGREAAFRRLRHLCLSADVATALAPLDCDTIAVAAWPDETALLALLDAPEGSRPPQSRC